MSNLCLALGALMAIFNVVVLAATTYIVPGAVWYDTDGNKIDAHGGMITDRDGTFYWTGHAAETVTPYMYSSTDLLNWDFVGSVAPSVTGLWRPKFAKPNGEYWGYLLPDERTAGDTGLFLDPPTDTYYYLSSAGSNNLQANEILSTGAIGDRITDLEGAYEAPGMLYVDGTYFLVMSSKTGWTANPNLVWSSTSIAGPWSGPTDLAPDSDDTYGSQNSFELTITGSETTTYIYMGDVWDSTGSAASNYMWLPMTPDTSAGTLTLDYYSMWTIDTSTGVVSTPSTKKRYEAEDAEVSGAAVQNCEICLSKRHVYQIKEQNEVIFRNVTGTGDKEWVTLHYTVNDHTAGDAYIVVNDESMPTNISELNMRAGRHNAVPVSMKLDMGGTNTIRFGSVGSPGFEATLDAIEFHN
ncbi:family 43 glycoside hydrolase [Cryphonectria parasitica EP155]|uniref:Family 43 glycoside hydrolase n=1 Tax=Cryphonectria parasitica (strain ATCC 38755 / EP155) TaxID=660469 RepID=A0A9P5CM88_CRYP1|nr:family 43 glycoside hydrolase [Cryphonectria parasitica EP155]KAF3762846.1 family 43 glycoside hydrolase [Cryphonectria parasitica EP155]